jgi:class 3 adenylate cyclase
MQDPDGIGLTSLNIGDSYFSLEDFEEAFRYHQKAIPYLANSAYEGAALRSLGHDLIMMGNEEEGFMYLDSSFRVDLSLDNILETTRTLLTIGGMHEEVGDAQLAITYFEKARVQALELSNSNTHLKEAYDGLARIYAATGDQRNAARYEALGQIVADSLRSIETNEKLNQLLFNYEMDKKEAEISLLQKDKELQQAELKRQRIIRNGFIGGFAAVLLFASVVLIQRNKIRKGKQLSDKLLLNILPAEVAEELKQTGQAAARDYEMVSILFTDFKDFTRTSATMNAIDLVAEIDACFKGFDQIIGKYDIEKIKTIGDAYMAASGLPIPSADAAKNAVQAALEMQQFITDRKAHHEANGTPGFEMRVGIHSGPVVAGVVGVKKFQYDIWGDTVNTAARVESSGESGKVNISHTTYTQLRHHEEFSFESRGMIETKGKGEIEMWFVQ